MTFQTDFLALYILEYNTKHLYSAFTVESSSHILSCCHPYNNPERQISIIIFILLGGGGGLSLSITVRIIIFPYINRYLTVIFKFPSHPIPVVGILANHIIRTNFGGGQGGGGQGAIVHTIGSWKIPQLKTEVWGVVFSPPPPLTIGQVLSSMDSATKKTSIFHKWVFRNWFNKSLLLNPTIVESHCRLDGATGKRDSLHTTIKELVDRPALIIISHESCHQQENTNWRLLPGSGELNASINLALEVWLQKLKLV